MATACVRVDASSFARIRLVWVRTVSVERPEVLGHGVGLHAVGQHLEDLALAGAQRAVALLEHDRRGQAGVHVELPAARGLDRPDQVARRGSPCARSPARPAFSASLSSRAPPSAVKTTIGAPSSFGQPLDQLADVGAGPPGVDDHHVGRCRWRRRPARRRGSRRRSPTAPGQVLSSSASDPLPDHGMLVDDQAAERDCLRGGHRRAAYPNRQVRSPPARSRRRIARSSARRCRGSRTAWR